MVVQPCRSLRVRVQRASVIIEGGSLRGGGVPDITLAIDRRRGLRKAQLWRNTDQTEQRTTMDEDGEEVLPCLAIVGVVRLFSGPILITVSRSESVASLFGSEVFRVAEVNVVRIRQDAYEALDETRQKAEDSFIALLRSLLSEVPFYYCFGTDLTRSVAMQANSTEEERSEPLWKQADPAVFWNRAAMSDFIRLDAHELIVPLVQGHVSIEKCSVRGREFTLILLSRRSWHRAGIRYLTRGIDSKGHTANFVETEQIVESQGAIASFVQIRGSVPVFWQQPPGIRYNPKPRIDVPTMETVASFRRHASLLESAYGDILVLNLVNQRGDEAAIGDEFRKHIQLYDSKQWNYVAYDFHRETKGMRYERVEELWTKIEPQVRAMGFTFCERGIDHAPSKRQAGVVRTNCMDCLDRTNVTQSIVARHVLGWQLAQCGVLGIGEPVSEHPEVERLFKVVWADNGDSISRQYTGTGALKADFTRTGKRSVFGMINDGINSLLRYVNHFRDDARQDALDLFLGRFVVGDLASHGAMTTGDDGTVHFECIKITRSGARRPTTVVLDVRSALIGIVTTAKDERKDFAVGDLALLERSTMHRGRIRLMFATNAFEFDLGTASARERLAQLLLAMHARKAPKSPLLARPPEKVRALVVSWNLGRAPPSADLAPLFAGASGVDLVAVSAQECEYTPRRVFPFVEADWVDRLHAALGEGFAPVVATSVFGTRLAVFARRELAACVSSVHTAAESLDSGASGSGARCGAAAAGLQLYGTSVAFIALALPAPHGANAADRTEAIRQVCETVSLGRAHEVSVSHDHVILAGEFNYAVSGSAEGSQSFSSLAKRDELRKSLSAGEMLSGFRDVTVDYEAVGDPHDRSRVSFHQRVLAYAAQPLHATPQSKLQRIADAAPSTQSRNQPTRCELELTLSERHGGLLEGTERCAVTLSDLHVGGLRRSSIFSAPDPYMTVDADFTDAIVRSTVCLKSTSPRWKEPLHVPSFIRGKENLAPRALLVTLWDANAMRDDDILGFARIPLHDAAKGDKVPFGAHFTLEGRLTGATLFGWVEVRGGQRRRGGEEEEAAAAPARLRKTVMFAEPATASLDAGADAARDDDVGSPRGEEDAREAFAHVDDFGEELADGIPPGADEPRAVESPRRAGYVFK